LQGTDLQDGKAQHVALTIDFFHHGIIRRLPEVPRLALEEDLQIVTFVVVPNRYVFSPNTSPLFTASVW
jgi:hypothetical protein